MTTCIKCPAEHTPTSGLTVFLAGGISNCSDWQALLASMVADRWNDVTLIDPRRSDFDASNPAMTDSQIEWEYRHLCMSDIVLFWFPPETLCPITLYELGVHSTRYVPIVVGCHPDYARRIDVIKQLSLSRPAVNVQDTLMGLVEQLDATVTLERRRLWARYD